MATQRAERGSGRHRRRRGLFGRAGNRAAELALAAIGIAASVIGAFYYLKVVKVL